MAVILACVCESACECMSVLTISSLFMLFIVCFARVCSVMQIDLGLYFVLIEPPAPALLFWQLFSNWTLVSKFRLWFVVLLFCKWTSRDKWNILWTRCLPVTGLTVSKHWRKLRALITTSDISLTGLIISSSGSGLLWEGAVLPLHHFSYASDHICSTRQRWLLAKCIGSLILQFTYVTFRLVVFCWWNLNSLFLLILQMSLRQLHEVSCSIVW